ncbi:MAG: reverse transcriptase-like protein [Candidatus Mycalebacterium zealandia]|nr:MAG: reverse transcriptase-like protein [Candidatus Mycalebacterium zealandia]
MKTERADDFAVANIDGASKGNPGKSAIGVVITGADGKVISRIKKFIGTKTNNQAEYTALITALRAAANLGKTRLSVKTDSLLLANQMNGLWKVKHPDIAVLFKEAKEAEKLLKEVSISHVRREKNTIADGLANEAIIKYSW